MQQTNYHMSAGDSFRLGLWRMAQRRTLVLRYTVRQTMSVDLHREAVMTVFARPNLRTEEMTMNKNESR